MLSNVAIRSLRPAAQTSMLRPVARTPSAATLVRSYAKYTPGKKAPPRTVPKYTPPGAASATGSSRQTSPGTSIPKDQTWTPKDAIKFAAPAAASGAAGVSAPASSAGSSGKSNMGASGEFNTAASPSANTEPMQQPGPTPEKVTPSDPTPSAAHDSPVSSAESTEKSNMEASGDFNPAATPSANNEPMQQPGPTPEQVTPSDPTPSPAQNSQSANAEFQGPQSSEANTEPEQPSTPLPDLRQGIPSTFDLEFGSSKKSAAQVEDTPNNLERDDTNVTAVEAGEPRERRRRGEDDYDASDYETSVDRQRAKLANYMYATFAAMLLVGSVYLGRPYGNDEEAPSGLQPADISGWSPASIYSRIKSRMSGSVEYYTEPTSRKLLPDVPEAQRPPYTLVLSLEDLLIHSEWSREHGWRTAKRPGVDYFLRYLSQYYELVVFTTVPYAMGDPVLRKLDPFRVVMWPLFREATKYEDGKYVKDLSYLNRPLDKTIIIDTKAEHVRNQPENAIVLPSWTGGPKDPHARDLVALIPFLEYIGSMGIQDTRKVIESFKGKDIPAEFARRESIAREQFNAQLAKEKSSRPKRSLGGLFNSALGMKSQGSGMSLDNETSVAEGLREGKMLSDQIRERGQREYMRLEEEIRKNGEKWLKEMEEEEKRLMESSMKDMRKSWFGGSSDSK